MPDSELAEIARRFTAGNVATVSDVLDELGHDAQLLPPEIAPLSAEMRVAGPAYAIETVPKRGVAREQQMQRSLEMIGAVTAGSVAVYQTHGGNFAPIGGIGAALYRLGGCVGVVTNGGCRDVDEILEEGLPVFARYVTPRDALTRAEVVGWGHAVEIGETRIETGDYVVGDRDGVAVIPAGLRDDVLERVEAASAAEDRVRAEVLQARMIEQGMSAAEAFEDFSRRSQFD
jgi:regulator of RNase E activity RraA